MTTPFIVTYRDKQYDVNNFLDSHPAGKDIILPFEGKDMTEEFDAVGHSKSAMRILSKYLVATKAHVIVNNETNDLAENQVFYMKKLITKEDPQYIHKVLGIVSLANYIYRYYLLLVYGSMFINTQ
jgi:cytochrome b involved in lipid metabolism